MSDAGSLVLGAFAFENDFCWGCGWEPGRGFDETGYRLALETHHMRKRPRVHEWWNLSRFCTLCHMVIEGHRVKVRIPYGEIVVPKLELAHVMWLKMRHEPQHYERRRYRRVESSIPRAARPPDWFQYEYRLRQGRYPGDSLWKG